MGMARCAIPSTYNLFECLRASGTMFLHVRVTCSQAVPSRLTVFSQSLDSQQILDFEESHQPLALLWHVHAFVGGTSRANRSSAHCSRPGSGSRVICTEWCIACMKSRT